MKSLPRSILVLVLAFVSATEVIAYEHLVKDAEIEVSVFLGRASAHQDDYSDFSGRKSAKGWELSITPLDLDWGLNGVAETFGTNHGQRSEPRDEHASAISDWSQYYVSFQKELYPLEVMAIMPESFHLYLFGKASFNEWKRNCNLTNPTGYWNDHLFASATVGLEAECGNFYGRAGINAPFWSDVDSGEKPDPKIGHDLRVGYKVLERFAIEFSHEKVSFKDQDLRKSMINLRFSI